MPLTRLKNLCGYDHHAPGSKEFAAILRVKHIRTAFFVLLLAGTSAKAMDCFALQPLAAMHDAYRALISEDEKHAKAVAANQLIRLVPIYSAMSFQKTFAEADLDVDPARLEKVLVDGFMFARDTLKGRDVRMSMSQLHNSNANWLSNTIARTACFDQESGQGSGAPGPLQISAPAQSARSLSQASAKRLEVVAKFGIGFVGILIACVLGFVIYHSRHFRIKRVERLPRFPVAFKAKATFQDQLSSIIVLDISAGGAKIECDQPPWEREPITLHLPCKAVPATIVWATAFYAGVMFEENLSETELDLVLNDEGVTTRSRLSNVF